MSAWLCFCQECNQWMNNALMRHILWINEGLYLLTESGWGGWIMCRAAKPQTQVWFQSSVWLCLGKRSTLVKIRERLWFTKHMCKVTVTFFSMKPDLNLSLTSVKCCEDLNATVKKFNNAAVTKLDAVGKSLKLQAVSLYSALSWHSRGGAEVLPHCCCLSFIYHPFYCTC